MEPGHQHCAYYDCDKDAEMIIKEDYESGGSVFDSLEKAVCPQHVPPCIGGQDPNFLWACGRPHLLKRIGEEDFEVIHCGPWGFE